ncbi:MAG: hypothetical protein ACREAS_05785 [Nitrososphaera sp.]
MDEDQYLPEAVAEESDAVVVIAVLAPVDVVVVVVALLKVEGVYYA